MKEKYLMRTNWKLMYDQIIFVKVDKVKSDTNVGTKEIVGDSWSDFSVPVRSSLIQIIAVVSSHRLQQNVSNIQLILC